LRRLTAASADGHASPLSPPPPASSAACTTILNLQNFLCPTCRRVCRCSSCAKHNDPSAYASSGASSPSSFSSSSPSSSSASSPYALMPAAHVAHLHPSAPERLPNSLSNGNYTIERRTGRPPSKATRDARKSAAVALAKHHVVRHHEGGDDDDDEQEDDQYNAPDANDQQLQHSLSHAHESYDTGYIQSGGLREPPASSARGGRGGGGTRGGRGATSSRGTGRGTGRGGAVRGGRSPRDASASSHVSSANVNATSPPPPLSAYRAKRLAQAAAAAAAGTAEATHGTGKVALKSESAEYGDRDDNGGDDSFEDRDRDEEYEHSSSSTFGLVKSEPAFHVSHPFAAPASVIVKSELVSMPSASSASSASSSSASVASASALGISPLLHSMNPSASRASVGVGMRAHSFGESAPAFHHFASHSSPPFPPHDLGPSSSSAASSSSHHHLNHLGHHHHLGHGHAALQSHSPLDAGCLPMPMQMDVAGSMMPFSPGFASVFEL
jgi:hypothetical protein